MKKNLTSLLIAAFSLLFLIAINPGSATAQGKGKGKAKGHSKVKAKPHGPPPWAPAKGYRANTRHIFFPDFNMYFDLRKGVYLHKSGTKVD